MENRNRTAAVVEKLQLGVDTQNRVNGGMNILRRHGPRMGPSPQPIGGADDKATLDAAAAQQAEHRVSPVIAAGRSLAARGTAVAAVIHARRAAELATEDHQ